MRDGPEAGSLSSTRFWWRRSDRLHLAHARAEIFAGDSDALARPLSPTSVRWELATAEPEKRFIQRRIEEMRLTSPR